MKMIYEKIAKSFKMWDLFKQQLKAKYILFNFIGSVNLFTL